VLATCRAHRVSVDPAKAVVHGHSSAPNGTIVAGWIAALRPRGAVSRPRAGRVDDGEPRMGFGAAGKTCCDEIGSAGRENSRGRVLRFAENRVRARAPWDILSRSRVCGAPNPALVILGVQARAPVARGDRRGSWLIHVTVPHRRAEVRYSRWDI